MQSNYSLLILLFIVSSLTAVSQETQLKIHAAHYENEPVYLWVEDDYFSHHKTLIAQSKIENGEASFNLEIKQITKVRIGIDYQFGSLFLEDQREYEVYFPLRNKDVNRSLAWNTQVELLFIDFPETDINLQISRFNANHDKAIATVLSFDIQNDSLDREGDDRSMESRKFSQKESLAEYLKYMATWDSLYAKNDSPFFNKYRMYTGASVAYSLGQKRIELYNSFLKEEPVSYNNQEYAHFFNAYYQNYLNSYDYYPLIEKRNRAFASDNARKSLEELLYQDSSNTDGGMQELVLLKSLYDYYPKHTFSFDSVIVSIIEEIATSSPYYENSLIANNYLQNLKKGKKGELFPDFEFSNRLGDTLLLSDFKGQMIYLQIFASWSPSSIAELELINELTKKYNNVRFISLSIDPKKEEFDSFLANNKKFKWEIGWIGVHPNVLELLSIYDLPLFYLIADDFSILNWPALWPSTGVEKIFYEERLKEKEEKKFRFWEDQTNKSKREE